MNQRPNAFERARAASLKLQVSFWTTFEKVVKTRHPKAKLSEKQLYLLGEDDATIGAVMLERRTLRLPNENGRLTDAAVLTRPVEHSWAALPFDLIEEMVAGIAKQAESEHRAANIEAAIQAAREFAEQNPLDIARDVLGADATVEEVEAFAAQLKFPEELLAGGEAAAIFFDDAVSTVRIEDTEDGDSMLAGEPPAPPGKEPLGNSEWDYYSPEELEDRGGPQSDWSYAFRVLRLCEAIRGDADRAVTLSLQLGAILREWEVWREYEEFIIAGIQAFERQSQRASQKPEKVWMRHVREDFAAGRIGDNVAAYARGIHKIRKLSPPSADRIQNFVHDLRKAQRHDAE